MKMTDQKKKRATAVALVYMRAKHDMNDAAMIRAESELFDAVGFWGKSIGNPIMARMPDGKSIRWNAEKVAIAWGAQ